MKRWAVVLLVTCATCSNTASRRYLVANVPKDKAVEFSTESFNPMADILFVVDNSGSMRDHQEQLARNIPRFTSVLFAQRVLDFRVAVLSSDMERGHDPCCGRFFGRTHVIDRQTPDADLVLAQNLEIGTVGSGTEMFFDPVALALTEPNLSKFNFGFLRPQAVLVVIFITDTDDQSSLYTNPVLFYDFLVGLKAGDRRKVMAFGAVIPSGIEATPKCKRDPSESPPLLPERLELFFSKFGRQNLFNLCDPDYGTPLAGFADEIVRETTSTISLSRAPVPDTIRVTYGDRDLPADAQKGWAFDPVDNVIRLGRAVDWGIQPSGSALRVLYEVARFPEEG